MTRYLVDEFSQDSSELRSPEEVARLQKIAEILPDIPNAPSGWNTDNHYFYEIINRNGKDIIIQLCLSSRNASAEFLSIADRINEIVSMKQAKKDWQWLKIFKTTKIQVPDDLNESEIFSRLDNALLEVQKFEEDLAKRLNG